MVLYSVIILVVILYYSFAKCYHWGKLGKCTGIFLYYFLQIYVTSQLSQQKFQLKIQFPCLISLGDTSVYMS